MSLPTRELRVDWIYGFNSDSSYLALSTGSRADCIWELARHEWAFEGIKWLWFGPSGTFAQAEANGTISILNLASRQQTDRLDIQALHGGVIALDPAGRALASWNPTNSQVEIWDLQ